MREIREPLSHFMTTPLKTTASKIKADWMPAGEIKFVDMGNGFTLIKVANENGL